MPTPPAAPSGPPLPAVRFPAVARLELDELLDQLIDRAQEVKATQGRLRGLLAANQHIAHGLDLDELLHRVVDSARTLVGADHGALGVVRDGHLIRFVHSGMDEREAAAIGELPTGKGVLGRLIDDPRPLRLTDLSEHEAAAGFPPGHPPMHSFLGTPVRVGNTVYGNLYLTDSERPEGFSAEDEELAVALAGTAGMALENALLLAEARRREQWQAAATEVTRELLATGGNEGGEDAALHRIVELAMGVGEADGAAVAVVDRDDPSSACVRDATGTIAGLRGRTLPTAGSLTQLVLDAHGPVVVDDARTDPRLAGVVDLAPETTALVAAPLHPGGAARGSVLTLVRTGGGAGFAEIDRHMIGSFAAQAGTALSAASSQRDRERLRRLEERETLLHQLSEHLLARLMRVGLHLTGLSSRMPGELREAVLARVDELDGVVRQVRDTVLDV